MCPATADTPQRDPAHARHFILGTAGHIDHGKTSLVRALTGTDTDRLPEERRRGMTIELGFAGLTIKERHFGIVDVPGHERFVRTMVAGATGIDIALIVVAADDSVMPQTIEHLDILHLLGVRRGVVAITKIDTVDSEMVEMVADEVQTLLMDTPLAQSPICPVSSITGQGLENLSEAIVSESRNIDASPEAVPFRMAVDRVFLVQGRGTVVTGSVLRGTVSLGDTLELWPGGETCRVRDLQTHGSATDRLTRGQRAAINISGIDREKVQRGVELTTPGYLQCSNIVDVRLDCLASHERTLKSTSVVRFEIGTTDIPVRIVLFDGKALQPGESVYAQLRCGQPLTSVLGQRFIIRDENGIRTIGGGVVLRPVALRKRRRPSDGNDRLKRLESGDEADRVEEVFRAAGFTTLTDLQLCARAGVELGRIPTTLRQLQQEKRRVPIAGTDVYVVPAAVDDLLHRLTHWLERFHQSHRDLPGRPVDAVIGWLERITNKSVAKALFDRFIRKKNLKLLGRLVCLPAFAPSLSGADEKLLSAMVEEIRAAGFQPPSLEVLSIASRIDKKRGQRLATLAVALGELVKIDAKIYLHTESEARLRKSLAEVVNREGSVTVGELREVLGSSRKYVVPFLEYLDRVGFTKRIGDKRVLADDG